jgi:decaprenylphospho-beta-D-erythro-pentofuranosid-2-ulose 2-reductase
MQKVIIIGATSAIAEATARLYAQRGDCLYLFARNEERLKSLSLDLMVRGAKAVSFSKFEASDFNSHGTLVSQAIQSLGGVNVLLIAHGTLPDQNICEENFDLILKEINTNGISVISFLTHIIPYFKKAGKGTIAVISSVAGDRGKRSNYIYGSAKGMISIYLQGLRSRLYHSNIHVITVKLGFVDTPMTAQFKKGLLWVKPDSVAKGIFKAVENNWNEVYLPWYWMVIMRIIKSIPEQVFKKIKM